MISYKVFLKRITRLRNEFESMKRDSNLMMNTIFFQKMNLNLPKRDSNLMMNTMFFQKMDSNLLEKDSNLKGYFLNRTFEINHGF